MNKLETLKLNIEHYVKDLERWEKKMVVKNNIEIVSGIRCDLEKYLDAVNEPTTEDDTSKANLTGLCMKRCKPKLNLKMRIK